MHRANSPAGDAADRVLIAANPRAGAGSPGGTVERLASVLRHHQFRVEIFTDLDTVTAAAERAWQAGELRALVAAGGDGTVAELVNRTKVGVPIAVFPLGTANLLAGYLGIRPTFQPFARMLKRGAIIRLDAGQAAGRIFLLMVGCGFDAEVVERLHSTRGGHISMWSYAKPIFESIRRYQYPQLRIWCGDAPMGGPASQGDLRPLDRALAAQGAQAMSEAAGGAQSVITAPAATVSPARVSPAAAPPGVAQAELGSRFTARWAFVVNLPCYAAKLQFAPGALGTDGILEVATFQKGGLFQGLRYLGYLWSGCLAWMSKTDYIRHRARYIRIEADTPVRYQLDGDPGGLLPLDIEVLPNRLTLLAPAERVEALAATTGTKA